MLHNDRLAVMLSRCQLLLYRGGLLAIAVNIYHPYQHKHKTHTWPCKHTTYVTKNMGKETHAAKRFKPGILSQLPMFANIAHKFFSLIRIRRLRLVDSSAPLPCYAVVVSHRTRHLRAPCELGRSDKIPSYNELKRIKRPTEYSERECVTPVLDA